VRWTGRSLGVVLAVLIALGCASTAAGAHQRKPRPLVLHPRFHVVGSALFSYIDGPYVVLLTPGVDAFEASGTVIDEQTGTRTAVSYPGCHLDEFPTWDLVGGPWLMFFCDRAGQWAGGFELYNLYTGEWRAVVPDPPQDVCDQPDYCGVTVARFGAHWIEWQQVPCRYCSATYLFQNIDTGQVRRLPGWRPGGRVIPDLDSRSLARKLCPPLTVPAGVPPPLGGPPPGALSLYGSFAIASPGAGGDVLERCGSRLKLAVGRHDRPLGASSHAIVWANSPTSRRLHGLFLPSLRRFVIATNPAAATSPYPGAYRVVLSSGELYVFDESGRVFATRAPTQRHRLARTRRHH
jgi:hypothetical protein